ncbi:MAG: acetaldehyde dehydrogenase (acetylating) [Acidobacteria bacterium]|nr:acetaldehyde dehydrogenase (acetylating) [Acidobacteriota bacterium]MBI3655458.1 acetaldehyde dehydrogenase (acetylating) [Acidobacteriota bacterium]
MLDKDLQSIQEARTLVTQTAEVQKEFAKFSQEKIDAVVAAMAEAGRREAERLARMAVEETGYGNVEDKICKNRFATDIVYEYIKNIKTVGILREDAQNHVWEVAAPMGVVAAIIPTTNPTSTTIYKSLIALKAGNGIVLSPHPNAVKCINESARILHESAVAAGAPPNIITCLSRATLEATQELMKHRLTAIILATGGPGLVRAAYSSGRPALGVGPGNVPAFIDRSAAVPKAVSDVLAGKTFDYGTLCSSENALVVDEPIHEQVTAELKQQGAHICSPSETEALGRLLVTPQGTLNTAVVGKSALHIAALAGIKVPKTTRALVGPTEGVGKAFPLSLEKLSPILAYYVVRDWQEGSRRCTEILNYGGLGHSMVLHCQNRDVIKAFALQQPAFRILVNTLASIGAVGYTTGLVPAMTLGCGSFGANITSDNIGPQHLLNLKRVAFETRPYQQKAAPSATTVPSAAGGGISRETIREIVDELIARRTIKMKEPHSLPARPTPPASPPPAPPQSAGSPVELKTPPEPPSAVTQAAKHLQAVVDFVSEYDVKTALAQHRKIHLSVKAIITPSARELGEAHQVFIREA